MTIRDKLPLSIFALAAFTALAGCGSDSEQPPIGERVTIQFRRDALGSGQMPVPPTTDNFNGGQVSMTGTLMKMNTQWMVLKFAGKEHWIPRAVVLLVRTE